MPSSPTTGGGPPDKEAFSVNEFCHAYGVGRSFTYQEINSGRLKTAKVGNRRIIPVPAAREWLAEQVEATAA